LALCWSVAVVADEPYQCFPYADKHWFGRSGNIESTAIVDTVLLTIMARSKAKLVGEYMRAMGLKSKTTRRALKLIPVRKLRAEVRRLESKYK
jgi:hypothetical protein